MKEFIVEDLQTEEQVDSFEAESLKDAVEFVLKGADFKKFNLVNVEYANSDTAYITISLPYGATYTYEVGEIVDMES